MLKTKRFELLIDFIAFVGLAQKFILNELLSSVSDKVVNQQDLS